MNIATEVLADELCETRLLPGKKTILYVGIKYDYGKPNWGLSYEHYNFYQTFLRMGYSVVNFDYMRIMQEHGIEEMSRMLLESVYYYSPDILFYFHYHDWVSHDVWKEIPVKKLIWLADDSWRYDKTRPVWELFDTVITTDARGHDRRQLEGFKGSVLSEWGYNAWLYRNLGLKRIFDVSFVGSCHSDRQKFINKISDAGINIHVFGKGWGDRTERISQGHLIDIYNKSKIVLNLSAVSHGSKIQVNARDFEATGCGAALVTHDSESIDKCYIDGDEIYTYHNAKGAANSIKDLLGHEKRRSEIARAGHLKARHMHQYVNRFSAIKDIPSCE